MSIVVILIAVALGLILLIMLAFMLFSYVVIGGETIKLDRDQRAECEKAIASGENPSLACRLYAKNKVRPPKK